MVWRKQRSLRLAMVGVVAVAALSAGSVGAYAGETPSPTPSPTSPPPTPVPTPCIVSSNSNGNTWLTSVAFVPTDPTISQLTIAPAFSQSSVGPYAVDIPAQETSVNVKATANQPSLVTIELIYQGAQEILQSGNQSASYLLSDGNALVLSVIGAHQCTNYTFSVQLVATTPTPSPTPTPTDTPTPTPIQIATPPLVTGVTPNVIQSEASPVTLTITGLNFDQTAVVSWNSHALQTQDMTASSLSATIPASFLTDIALPSLARVTVLNPSTQLLSQDYEVALVDPKTIGQAVVYTGANATAAISTLSASYSGTDPAGIFVASYIKNPTGNSTLQSNSFWDVRFNPLGSATGSLTCVFTASGSPTGQQLYFYSGATGSWQAVQNANLQINSGENTVTVVFSQTSYPHLTDLKGTVFSIAAATSNGAGGGFLWILLVVVLLLSAGGGTYYWWWRNHKAPTNEVTLQFK